MKQLVLFSALVLLVAACGKDKFQTKPQLKLISVSNTIVPVNGGMRVVLQYTDKQGDVSNTFYIYKQRLNARVVETVRDSLVYPVPQFPNTPKGDFELNLAYQNDLISAFDPPHMPGNPDQLEPDTLNLKFLVSDKAGNKSDTVTLNNIVVLR